MKSETPDMKSIQEAHGEDPDDQHGLDVLTQTSFLCDGQPVMKTMRATPVTP